MKWPKIPDPILGKFNPTSWVLAQETHMLLGILAIVFAKAYHLPLWWGAVAILAFATLKEIFIDPPLEGNPFFWNGAVDLVFYGVGILIAYGLITLLAQFV